MDHFAPTIDGFKVFIKSAEQRFRDVVLKKNGMDVSEDVRVEDVIQLNNSDQVSLLFSISSVECLCNSDQLRNQIYDYLKRCFLPLLI